MASKTRRVSTVMLFLLSCVYCQSPGQSFDNPDSFLYCITELIDGESVVTLKLDHAVRCSIPPSYKVKLTVPVNQNTSAIILQLHTVQEPLTLISLNEEDMNATSIGNHVGMISYPTLEETTASWMLMSDVIAINKSVDVLLIARVLDKDDPVPGACNQEFSLENDPTIHFKANPTYDLALIEFAPANIGVPPSVLPPVCDVKSSPRFELVYDIYVMYFSVKEVTNKTFFTALSRMIRAEEIQEKAIYVKTVKNDELTEIYLTTYKGRGVSYNVIVRHPETNVSVAYVPYLDYACDFRNGSVCLFTDIGPTMIYTFSALLGFILCFFGHWIFLYEMFMMGFLPASLGFYMWFGAAFTIHSYLLMTLAVSLALLCGFLVMTLWWRFALVVPTILWISLCLGFLVSACVFFTPLSNLSLWQNSTVFGLSFMCIVLIIPIFGLTLPKWLSYAACSIIGSYMIISAFSFLFGGALQYIVLNIVHRAYIENFEKAVYVTPFIATDWICAFMWVFLAVVGFLTQWHLNKDLPDFQEHQYKRWKELRAQRRMQYLRSTDNQTTLRSGTLNVHAWDTNGDVGGDIEDSGVIASLNGDTEPLVNGDTEPLVNDGTGVYNGSPR